MELNMYNRKLTLRSNEASAYFIYNKAKENHVRQSGCLLLPCNETMKKINKTLIMITSALIVIGIVVFGSMSLYSKLNQVDELNGRLEEAAAAYAGQQSKESKDQQADKAEQTSEPEPEPSLGPVDVSQQSPTATLTSEQQSDNVYKDQKLVNESSTSEEKARKKQEIDAAITAEMQQLRASCQAASHSLVQQIAQELSADDDATLATIQSKYLNEIFSAESDCDIRFNQLVGNAQSEYEAADLGNQALPDWSSQYESAKAQARADAFAVIANSLN
ncbi:hypothetical protein [Paenibacillus sp. sgz302251]|uniref:hypothetical protein n=1 Tax=Paenibacillus sp. sgz302251 TaxID=3414493 RepID=UPI003C7CC385